MKAARITTILVALALSALAGSARAQEQAFTNRATELRERADANAKLLANLPNNTAVKVVSRSGGWTQVEAAGAKGWVRVFHLRFPATVAESSSGSTLGGLTAALGFGKPKQEATKISTVGVRGLSEDEIKNANPDANALKKMQSLRVEKPEAERFAREAKLAAQSVAYPSGGS